MAQGKLYNTINAFIEETDNGKLNTTSNSDIYTDRELDMSDIECDFDPHKGDRVKLHIMRDDPPKVYKIEPWDELRVHTGKITSLTQSYGTVDDDFIFYISEQKPLNWEAKHDDDVKCVVIEGEYTIGNSKYEWRCASIEKVKENEEDKRLEELWFNDSMEGNVAGAGAAGVAAAAAALENENVDSDTEAEERHVAFDHLKRREPNQEYYDLPPELFNIHLEKNPRKIMQKLNKFVPHELSYNTYKKRFHALIWLEEVEMKVSFDRYKSRTVWIEPEKIGKKNRFSIKCSKIAELRPPIAVGDKIEVRNLKNERRFYRGLVERVREDRFILRFRRDFEEDWRLGDTYSAEFIYSRTIYQRKHAAVDYAKRKLDEAFLFPSKLTLAKTLQLNAELKDDKLLLDGAEVPWYKDNLNEEQKFAVAGALRGECRPYPFVVFGPPGTGKTSTIIEIILQTRQHVKDCVILVATQSNHAANVVASRLISADPTVSSDMLRLVSNAVLDRKTLPRDLHKVSASVMNTNLDCDDLLEFDDLPADIKRNISLEHLRKFKIIIGTCVGLGVLFGTDFSNGYFTHVLIDEAAQCNECEALIPISFVNLERGQIIMAGDPLQLPPITLSNHAKHYDLVKSMLERYVNIYKTLEDVIPGDDGFDPRLVTKLRRNYRSLPSILHFYDKQFYDSQLISTICAENSPEAIKLRELARILPKRTDPKTKNPFGICFVNVDGRNERMQNKKSWENKEEMALIRNYIPKLLERKIDEEDIGVITPYHAQVISLKKELKIKKRITVGTVEEFQGEEKKVILISAVKTSGKEKALQFIFCPKRLNTAISRARMLVVIFGRQSLLSGDENWTELIEYCKTNESYIDGKDLLQML
ncbi:probable RNA helicase armi [Sitodiplosis mosellana]|uniref:probable RNA helicase armi n=1 Tax=Sitodiplosis mosellana TaxID=263140 RepID=UPI002444B843|nr:probable RNA helicase armi [Sitodiplosis mosellana]